MLKIAHIINPVNAPEGSELRRIQPITFKSIRAAKIFAEDAVDVELYAVAYEEDGPAIPSFFKRLKDLDRSVLDLASFTKRKKLPLIIDILNALFNATDSEWLIYTNADICLMPHFYKAVVDMIAEGNDAILINRRRISKAYNSIDQLPEMYSEIGGSHPGYDCFVFHRSLQEKFKLEGICIGVPFIEVSLLHNLIAFAQKIKYADQLHLTFHIGIEVMPPVDQEYYLYNRGVYESQIKPVLYPLLDINKFPYSALPLHKRIVKSMLNPCISTALVLELEGKSLKRKLKILLDEVRWRILAK